MVGWKLKLRRLFKGRFFVDFLLISRRIGRDLNWDIVIILLFELRILFF